MTRKAFVTLVLVCLTSSLTAWAQVRAGTPEDQLFAQITAEKNPDTRLELVDLFEKRFPKSTILPSVYLVAVDVYREKQDRGKINEYGEKVLLLDKTNVTAMMVLARNYAIEARNLDRAIELAQQALDRMAVLRTEPLPQGYSATQWQDYLRTSEDSAGQILGYAKAMKARADSVRSSPAAGATKTSSSADAAVSR